VRILVVSDDVLDAERMLRQLSSEGHTCVHVRSGSEALAAALKDDPDLLVCDLEMSDVPPLSVVRAIKAQAPHLPVIAIADWPAEWRAICDAAGISCILRKPIELDSLREQISLVVKSRTALRVLLVDPDSIHRIRVTKNLGALGCEVKSFDSAASCFEAVAGGTSAGLVVADADIPGLTELIAWCRGAHVPIFAFSADSGGAHAERMIRAGVALMLSKPVDCSALLTQARFLAG
jgi:CheY-like chemotaxis protein